MALVQENRGLWNRLLAGEIAEVFVFGGSLSTHLPQTLGLEVIAYPAYVYTPDGMPRSGEELARVARELAASKRWIAEGAAPIWSPAFMERAQAIIYLDTFQARMSGPSSQRQLAGDPAVLASRGGRWLARRVKRPKDDDELGHALSQQSWTAIRRDPVGDLLDFARLHFPEKLLHVTTHEQLKALRRVRVPRT